MTVMEINYFEKSNDNNSPIYNAGSQMGIIFIRDK